MDTIEIEKKNKNKDDPRLVLTINRKVQNHKIRKLGRKSGVATGNLLAIFINNPDIVNLVLLEIGDDDEMPALLFDWNGLGVNDTAIANCRNGEPL
ncbi:hypothetical protein GLOIN_2v1675007 [Rhizophagus clarus]|uniref:Uncharacterized protein n=1 Tax=Rhizophagus clarus TaxID=94130 RepID=A0A8H3QUB7_9GLOM|nr:hypothetical protein GLOIN_2v1675007 [Rhizophagus clarus]